MTRESLPVIFKIVDSIYFVVRFNTIISETTKMVGSIEKTELNFSAWFYFIYTNIFNYLLRPILHIFLWKIDSAIVQKTYALNKPLVNHIVQSSTIHISKRNVTNILFSSNNSISRI